MKFFQDFKVLMDIRPKTKVINGLGGCYTFRPLEGGKVDIIKSDMKVGTLSTLSSSVGGVLSFAVVYMQNLMSEERNVQGGSKGLPLKTVKGQRKLHQSKSCSLLIEK